MVPSGSRWTSRGGASVGRARFRLCSTAGRKLWLKFFFFFFFLFFVFACNTAKAVPKKSSRGFAAGTGWKVVLVAVVSRPAELRRPPRANLGSNTRSGPFLGHPKHGSSGTIPRRAWSPGKGARVIGSATAPPRPF